MGLGSSGRWVGAPTQLRADVARIRRLTSRPFGVNHVLAVLDPAVLEVTLEERPPVLSLAWGEDSELVGSAHERGMRVVHQVTTVDEAERALDAGADVLVAQGVEGGGHVGRVATMALVPGVLDVAGSAPVLAAGGIADGRGLAAAIALGAQGVLMGTRFLATPEAPVSDRYRDAIVRASSSDTVVSKFLDDILGIEWPGARVRSLRHPLTDEWADRPGEWQAAADELRPQLEQALEAGEFVLAGEASGLIREGRARG